MRMSTEFLNVLTKEKNRGDEPIQVTIHIYMEMPQGNSLYCYLIQTKMPFFKNRQQEASTVPFLGLEPVGGERV
jgi:hypothetical protein